MSPADPDRKIGPAILVIIVLFFVIGAMRYIEDPVTDRNVLDDMNGLVFGLQSLGQGDAAGFAQGVTDALPILGLIIVLFIIYYYLFTTILGTLFSKKMSVVLSLVVLIYTVANRTIYNKILSLNVFVIGLIVFSAMLIMIWGFTENTAKNLRDEFKKSDPTRKERELSKDQIKQLKDYIRKMKEEQLKKK